MRGYNLECMLNVTSPLTHDSSEWIQTLVHNTERIREHDQEVSN